ncbi:MOSC domain-containing protein [Paenibacillus mendelii]|uniref:MOSC domain-containing protein n=1 Tax=Paenibacillus mendelii TaxID=206163 RepID=A0ABV6J5N4_9BACL|nr:MOSC domain-containing protein [Paenibacillus mendelii]MCQ6560122.1 MOSC domain-containing protein [Paenibacillus mendelii]
MTKAGKLVSLNVAMPIQVNYGSKEVITGIFKQPVQKRLHLGMLGLSGDGQGDLVNHGGMDKAVCVYSEQHFPYWEKEWGHAPEAGAFGENFTVTAMTEEQLHIGDVLHIGGAVVQVSQPRQPCFKLAMKHGRPELTLQVQSSGYTGYYFRVLQEGDVGCGDEMILENPHPAGVTIAEANRVMYRDKKDIAGIRRLLDIDELSSSWRETLTLRLKKIEGEEQASAR